MVYAAVQRQLRSRLFLADLGGSERLKNTRTHDGFKAKAIQIGDDETSRVSWDQYYASRGRLTESVYINQGLYALQAGHASVTSLTSPIYPSHLLHLLPLQRCIEALITKERRAHGHGDARAPPNASCSSSVSFESPNGTWTCGARASPWPWARRSFVISASMQRCSGRRWRR